jgi:hypothetical protein
VHDDDLVTVTRTSLVVSVLLCSLVEAGCTSTKPAAPNDATALLLALAPECPKSAAPDAPDGPPRVFVEMVVVDADIATLRAARSVEALTSDPSATVVSAHVLARDGEKAELAGAHVTSHVDPASLRIAVDVATDGPPTRTTATVADGQRLILGSAERNGRRVVRLLVPTVVRSDADLRRLFECKREHARQARAGADS